MDRINFWLMHIEKKAYIQTAISSTSFCRSAKIAVALILRSPGKFGFVMLSGKFIIYLFLGINIGIIIGLGFLVNSAFGMGLEVDSIFMMLTPAMFMTSVITFVFMTLF